MSSRWVEGHCHHVMVVVWSCWMEGSSPLSSWRWCARADVVVVVSPCHGRLVVIARLGGGVVASVVLASLSLSRPWHLLWVSRRYRKAGWRGGRLRCPGAGMHTLALLSSSCHGRLDVFVLAWTCCRLAVIVFIVLAWTRCHHRHCRRRRVMVAFAMHASLSSSLSWWWLRHQHWFLSSLSSFSCARAAVVVIVVVDLVWMHCCRRRHHRHPEGHDGRDAGRRAGRRGRRCIVVVVVVVAALSMLDIAVIHVAVGAS